jgi:hypothetical protein
MPETVTGLPYTQRKRARRLAGIISPDADMKGPLWFVAAGFLAYALFTYNGRPFLFTLSGVILGFFALLPAWLWSSGRVPGLPIFPLYAATYLATHVLQFLLAEPRLRDYPAEAILRAALTASGFLLVGTIVWSFWARRPRRLPSACLTLEGNHGTSVLLLVLFLGMLYTAFDHAAWLSAFPVGMVTAARSIFRGPVGFATFVLALRLGKGLLKPTQCRLFFALFLAYCLVEASSTFLVGVVLACLMLVLGLTLGRNRLPWATITTTLVIIGTLHVGKAELRSRYWAEGRQGNTLTPQHYPAFYADWVRSSLQQMALNKQEEGTQQSILSRANTAYLLLQAQQMTPKEVPFFEGATYAIIPSALVPRLFNAEKASPHDSTSLLNVHYGNQTLEETEATAIGWGLLNEAYANFGYPGCFVVAVLVASFFGLVTWWCKGMPADSVASLVGIYTLGFALQTEMTAAIFITAYVQGLVGLLLMAWLFSKRVQIKSDVESAHERLSLRRHRRPSRPRGAPASPAL